MGLERNLVLGFTVFNLTEQYPYTMGNLANQIGGILPSHSVNPATFSTQESCRVPCRNHLTRSPIPPIIGHDGYHMNLRTNDPKFGQVIRRIQNNAWVDESLPANINAVKTKQATEGEENKSK